MTSIVHHHGFKTYNTKKTRMMNPKLQAPQAFQAFEPSQATQVLQAPQVP
jgi:hypothetical protein